MSTDLGVDDLDIARAFLAMQHGVRMLDADPLASFRCTSEVQRDYVRHQGHCEIYLHSGNKFGKSTIGIAVDIACCQGRDELDGIPLPHVPLPARWGLFVPDYPSHVTSTQPIIEALLGDWPKRFERHGQVIVAVRIKPIGWHSDDPSTWSLLKVYSCENRRAGVGARLYGAHFDEPPPIEILREVRKAGEASTVFPLGITATPLKRSQWQPLRADYPDPAQNEGRIVNGYLRLRGESFDNTALTERDKRELLRIYANDPLRDARLHGHEINTEGSSPFRRHYAELMQWLERCTDGEVGEWDVTREVITADGKELVTEVVEVEVHEERKPGHVYRVIPDPSLGIDDGEHDPCGLVVFDMTARIDVAAYRGYIGEFGLGVLAAGLGRAYGEAMVDADVTGGYGSALLSGLRAAGYRRIVNHASGRDGLERTHLGFTIDASTRAEFMSAINEALLASQAGHPFMRLRTRWVVSDLVDLVLKDGKPVTGSGMHDEGFICAGRFASLVTPDRRPYVPTVTREMVESPREAGVRAMREEMGLPALRRTRDGRPPGTRMRRMNVRPR